MDSHGQPFTRRNSFGVWFQRQFAAMSDGRAFSTTLLRHSFVDALDLRQSKEARAEIARLLLLKPEQTPSYRLNLGTHKR